MIELHCFGDSLCLSYWLTRRVDLKPKGFQSANVPLNDAKREKGESPGSAGLDPQL